MSSFPLKSISSASLSCWKNVMLEVPEELVVEILARLPGKQLGRCRCVCKSWRSLIGSRLFAEAHRKLNLCLLLYWSEEGGLDRRLRFYYSPLRRREEEFVHLRDILVNGSNDPVSQLVNGLICVGRCEKLFGSDLHLTIHSVFTGEEMKIPDPVQYFNTQSTFHLGYDPRSRRYKLLRLIFRRFHPVRADIITLGPSREDFRWRVVDCDSAGMANLSAKTNLYHYTSKSHEARTFSGDGILCWIMREEGLILFDLNAEVFRWVELPSGVNEHGNQIVPRAHFGECGGLALLSLWVLPREGDCCWPEHFVLEGGKWSKKKKQYWEVELPEKTTSSRFVAANGSEVLLLMDGCRDVYSSEMGRFRVGMIPHNKALDLNSMRPAWDVYSTFDARLCRLLHSNDLYLPLDDVLTGQFHA